MSNKPTAKSHPLAAIEWWLVVLVPVFTILAGAAMIHVASSFGFTALGEPVVTQAHGR